jgi:hypothetical protein
MSPGTSALLTTNQIPEIVEWQPPIPPTDLIFDDGEPLERNRHRIAMNSLLRSLEQALADRFHTYSRGHDIKTCFC